MKGILIIVLSILFVIVYCEDVIDIIKKVDKNMIFENVIIDARMIIKENNDKREMNMKIYIKDKDNILIEILQSSEGNLSRFMKKKGQMYLYIPTAGQSIIIKGHMLKEGFMGSDFSYEDLSENRKTDELYNLELINEDTLYIILMNAKVKDAPYKTIKSYIDKHTYLPIKQEIYSSQGLLLKEFIIKDYIKLKNRCLPKVLYMYDKLKKNSYTKIEYLHFDFNSNIDNTYFNMSYFER